MKKALIFFGGWEGHQPRECAQLFRDGLAKRGFAVDLRDDLAVLSDAEALKSYSVIIPTWSMGEITKEQEANLVAAIRSGVGLAGCHGGMADAFRGRVEYQWAVGGIFASHPDNFRTYQVELKKKEDPIFAGITDFTVHTEQYYMLVDPCIEVLATTTFGESVSAPWTKGVVMPVVWKKRFGEGRVFFCALGHHVKDFIDVPQQLEITLRGIEWAAR